MIAFSTRGPSIDEDLDPNKTAEVHRAANRFADSFSDSHTGFIAKLRAIAEELK